MSINWEAVGEVAWNLASFRTSVTIFLFCAWEAKSNSWPKIPNGVHASQLYSASKSCFSIEGSRLLPMFLKGPGCTRGTIMAALVFCVSNFIKLTDMSASWPVSSRCFSNGTLSFVTQLSKNALKKDIAGRPYEVLPRRSRENRKRYTDR